MFKQNNVSDHSKSIHFSGLFMSHTASVLWGLGLLILLTQISIPLKPVAITLQTVGVMLLGLRFERKAAIQAVLFYIVLGSLGMPIFTNFQGGIAKLMGPSGGYLIGFLFSIDVMTRIRPLLNPNNIFHLALNALIGTIIIYACGVLWLSHLIGFKAAIYGGLLPFILPGLVKILLLSGILRYLRLGPA